MQYSGALFNLGKAFGMQGQPEQAAEAYAQAIQVLHTAVSAHLSASQGNERFGMRHTPTKQVKRYSRQSRSRCNKTKTMHGWKSQPKSVALLDISMSACLHKATCAPLSSMSDTADRFACYFGFDNQAVMATAARLLKEHTYCRHHAACMAAPTPSHLPPSRPSHLNSWQKCRKRHHTLPTVKVCPFALSLPMLVLPIYIPLSFQQSMQA